MKMQFKSKIKLGWSAWVMATLATATFIPAAIFARSAGAAVEKKTPQSPTPLQTEILSLLDSSDALSARLARILSQAQGANTPGVGAIDSSRLWNDITQAENELGNFRFTLENALTATAPTERELGYLVAQLANYCRLSAQIIQARALKGEMLAIEEAQKRFALKVPYRTLRMTSGFDQARAFQQYLGGLARDRDSLTVYDERSGLIKLSESFIQGIEAGAAANTPTEERFVKISKAVIVNSLWRHIGELNSLLSHPVPGNSLPRPSAALKSELGPLLDLDQRSGQTERELEYREGLLHSFPYDQALKGALQLGSAAFAEGYFSLATEDAVFAGFSDSVKAKFVADLQAHETRDFKPALEAILRAYPFSYLESGKPVTSLLAEVVAKAKFFAVLPVLNEFNESQQVDRKFINALSTYVEGAKKSYENIVASELAPQWAKAAPSPARLETQAQARKRAELVKDLMAKAKLVRDLNARSMANDNVDLKALRRAIDPCLASRSPLERGLRPDLATVSQYLDQIFSAPSYPLAQRGYAIVRNKLLALGKSGQHESAQIQADLHALDQAAALAGLSSSITAEAPKLNQLALDQCVRDTLVTDKKNVTLDQPLLSAPIDKSWLMVMELDENDVEAGGSFLTTFLQDHFTFATTPLFKLLAQDADRKDFAHASLLIDEAVVDSLGRIQKDFDRLEKVKSSEALMAYTARSSYMKTVIGEQFPTLEPFQRRMIEQLVSSVKTRQGWGDFMKAYSAPMNYLFMTMGFRMAVDASSMVGLRALRPLGFLLDRIETPLMPYLAGYFATAMPMIAADLGFQFNDWLKASRQVSELRDLFYTGATAPARGSNGSQGSSDASDAILQPFFDYLDVQSSLDVRASAGGQFLMNSAFQVGFLSMPLLMGEVRHLSVLAQDKWLLSKFETIGFKKGEYTMDRAEIETKAQAARAQPFMTLSRRLEIDRAAQSILGFFDDAETLSRQLGFAYRALGLQDAPTLDMNKLHAQIDKLHDDYVHGRITERQMRAANNGYQIIMTYTSMQLDAPGWLRTKVYQAHRWVREKRGKPAPRSPAMSDVRWALLTGPYQFVPASAEGAGAAAGVDEDGNVRGFGNVKTDYYEVLGVSPEATAAELKSAFRRQSRKFHPDFNPGDAAAVEKFRQVSEAYNLLGDADKRVIYDKIRRQMGYK